MRFNLQRGEQSLWRPIWATDIGNAHLEAKTKEKLVIINLVWGVAYLEQSPHLDSIG